MVPLSFEPLHSDFGVCVKGLNLSEYLSSDSVTAIQKAIDCYSFLWFPNQSVSDDMQLTLTNLLGEPEHLRQAYNSRNPFATWNQLEPPI